MRASSRGKEAAQPSATNTQLSLFDNSVIEHVAANVTALCLNPPTEIKRRMMQTREAKALQIVQAAKLTRVDNLWIVPSQTTIKKYAVDLDHNPPTCTCLDYEENKGRCKHILAVQYQLRQESGETLPEPERVARPTYKQSWHEYNLAQTTEKAKVLELLYALCEPIEDTTQRMGRPRIPLRERVFSSVYKIYSTISGRRFTTDLREAQRRGYVSTTPNFSSVYRFLESDELTPVLHQLIVEASLPLKGIEENFAADSTGFRTKGYSTWFSAKYNREIDKSEWIKCHVMCGTLSHIVTAVEVTDRKDHDSPYLPALLNRTAQSGFQMKEVSADKGYDSFNNRRLVLVKGAIPYIPYRSLNKPEGKNELWRRMYHFYHLNRDEFNAHYHRRSNVETVFQMIKSKFGEQVRSKTKTAQVNEVLCKVLCHNLYCVTQSIYEFGLEATFASTLAIDANVIQ